MHRRVVLMSLLGVMVTGASCGSDSAGSGGGSLEVGSVRQAFSRDFAATADATIYSAATGNSGDRTPQLLVGTKQNGGKTWRSLIKFDLSAIPTGATVTGVTLKLGGSHVPPDQNPPVNPSQQYALYKLSKDWREGAVPSPNPTCSGGQTPDVLCFRTGVPPRGGSPTWINAATTSTSPPVTLVPWQVPGADGASDRASTASATFTITALGAMTVASTTTGNAGLVSDVTAWVRNPSTNHGWLVRSVDEGSRTARALDARDDGTGLLALTVAYDPCTGVVCTASDQCHSVGTCDPSTGVCSNPAKANNAPCADGNDCTGPDTCQSGVCVTPKMADGSACVKDNDACTMDICTNGICTNNTVTPGCRVWGPTINLNTTTAFTQNPRAAISSNGTAIATWQQAGANFNIYARHFAPLAWDSPTALQRTQMYDAHIPVVAMDGSGNGLVAWVEFNTNFSQNMPRWNRYSPASGTWGGASPIDQNRTFANDPSIGMDASGNAMAIYTTTAAPVGLYAARLVPGAFMWDPGVSIQSVVADAPQHQIAVSSQGSATAVWTQGGDIWANRYATTGGWGTASQRETGSGGVTSPAVATNDAGDAVVVWGQSPPTPGTLNLWSSSFSGGVWGPAELVEHDDSGSVDGTALVVVLDNSGTASVAFVQTTGTGTRLYLNRRPAGGTWPAPSPVPDVSSSFLSYDMGMDSNGNLLWVWNQTVGSQSHVTARRFDRSACTQWPCASSWQSMTDLEIAFADGGTSSQVDLAVAPNGLALAVWLRNGGNSSFESSAALYR